MTVKGLQQGKIEGPVNAKGREYSILIDAWDFGVTTPVDPATGRVSGKRQHSPLQVVKQIDTTSPQLFTASVNNEALTSVQLQVWETTPSGTESEVYVINLTNAAIVSFGQSQEAPESRHGKIRDTWELERIAFTYQKIEVTWTDGQVSATDSWEQ